MAASESFQFSDSLYLPFRPFADRAGLECLDTRCDLWTDFGGPCAYPLSLDGQTLEKGDEINPSRPLFGLKTLRGVDRFRLTITQLKTQTGSLTPTPFYLQVKLGQAGCGEDAAFAKVITLPDYDRTGLIVQISGVLFDTVQVWGGNIYADQSPGPNTQQAFFRAFVDRCGHGANLTDYTVIDGPFT